MQLLGLAVVAGAAVWWFEGGGQEQFFPSKTVIVKKVKAKKAVPGSADVLPDLPDIPAPGETPKNEPSIAQTTAPTTPAEPSEQEKQAAIAQKAYDDTTSRYNDSPLLALTGMGATRDTAKQQDAAALKDAIESGAWNAYRNYLTRSLTPAIAEIAKGSGPMKYEALWKEAPLYQAFLRWNLLGRFPESSLRSITHDENAREMLTWLMNNPAAMEETLLTVKPEDNADKVMLFLKDAWTWDTKKTPKYYNLALATAVVFDREMKAKATKPEEEVEVIQPLLRYIWYVERDEQHDLAMSVADQTARDLTWVVCAPVKQSELDWVIKELKFNKRNWDSAYGSIEYLMERAVKGLNPYKAYTFAEIQKEGGICGDQTYFCANTARAAGIPAMSFSGETDLGGHAWAALKTDSNGEKWNTNVGRIGGVAKGQTDCAQTGKALTEQEVWLWNDRGHTSARDTLWTFNQLWLSKFLNDGGQTADAASVVRLANERSKTFVETWDALYDVLESETKLAGDPANPASVKNWKEFASDMRREFRENPRMAAIASKAEDTHVFPYGDDMDAHRTLARERRRVERDTSEQKDLIAESLKREADLLFTRKGSSGISDISQLYDRALRDYGGSVTGFKKMAADYFAFCKDDKELARKAARDVELAFKRVVESGTTDWFRAKTEGDIHRMICNYYREAGEPERAEMLEKRIERLMREAEKKALK